MRNLIMLVSVAMATLFSGCADVVKYSTLEPSGLKYMKAIDGDEIIVRTYDKRFTLKDALHILSKEVLDRNASYFVLTSSGTNNLEGFPINTYKELNRYISLHETNPKFTTNGHNYGIGKTKTLRHRSGTIRLFALIVGDEYKNSFISVWDANKTFNDTK